MRRRWRAPQRLRLHRVRHAAAALARALPGLRRVETLVEERVGARRRPAARSARARAAAAAKPRPLREIDADAAPRLATGIAELDRVLGGGLVPGSVVLLGGEPGIGKSTLALQLARGARTAGRPCSTSPARRASSRCGCARSGSASCPKRCSRSPRRASRRSQSPGARRSPRSCWSTRSRRCAASASSRRPARSRRCASARRCSRPPRRRTARRSCWSGHVTKEGTLAGPRVLEHLVDVVLALRGRPRARVPPAARAQEPLRLDAGGRRLHDGRARASTRSRTRASCSSPSAAPARPGSCVVPVLEGSRPMLSRCRRWSRPRATAPRAAPLRHRRRAPRAAARGARPAQRRRSARARRLRERGRRRARRRARRRPRARAGARLEPARPARCPPTSRRAARSASAARCAASRGSTLRLREAARLGFRRVLVPAGARAALPRRRRELVPVARLADAVAWLRANRRSRALSPAVNHADSLDLFAMFRFDSAARTG